MYLVRPLYIAIFESCNHSFVKSSASAESSLRVWLFIYFVQNKSNNINLQPARVGTCRPVEHLAIRRSTGRCTSRA